MFFEFDGFQLMTMIVGFNWLLMGSNTYQFLYKVYCLNSMVSRELMVFSL